MKGNCRGAVSFWHLIPGLLLCLLIFCLTGCTEPQDERLSIETEAYARALEASLAGSDLASWEIEHKGQAHFLQSLRSHLGTEAYDLQAVPLLEAYGSSFHWYPQYAATVVLAVDRHRTEAKIRSWQDLLHAGEAVGITLREPEFRYLLTTLSYALEGDFSVKRAASFLSRLLRAGLRLPDGRCDEGLYPPASDYRRAAKPRDYLRINELGQEALRTFNRNVLRTRRFTAADSRESMVLAMLFILVTIAWGGHMVRRIMSRRVRLLTLIIALLLVLWTVLRIFKWQMPGESAMNRYSWYSYYIFLFGLPLVLLRLADAIGKPEDAPTPLWWKICLGINLGLLFMVMTNDLHMHVFWMDLRSSDWATNYIYGPGYYFLWAVNVFFFLGALFMLLQKGRDSTRRYAALFPIAFSVLLLAYAVLYGMRIPPVWETDFTIMMGTFSLLFLQTAIYSGLIPVNSKYEQLFAHSPLAMGILDERGEAVLFSAAPSPPQGTTLRFNAISGGMATWRDDLSAVHALQRGLAKTVRKLERTNAMLRYEHRVLSEMEALAAKKKIQVDLDALIDSQLAEISTLLEDTGGDEKRNKSILASVGLRLCYLKRRSHLMFWKKQYRVMDSDELMIYLRELGTLAEAAGLTCACIAALSGELYIDAAIACYSFLFEGLRFAIEEGQSEIICRLSYEAPFVLLQLLGESPFEGLIPGDDIPAGAVELRGDGFLFQAMLKIEGGAAHA